MKILMVCLGNICRSPLAEGILKSKLDQGFVVDSAGTIDYHKGEEPDLRSVKTALKYGVDISKQKSRPIKKEDLADFDIIFCMDKNNYKDVLSLADEHQKSKIKLIHEEDKDVPDPYYGTLDDFDKVYKMLDNSCEIIAEKLKNNTF